MKTSATLLHAFQGALAERSADRIGKPSETYMLGYMVQMLTDMAEESPYVTEKIQGHLDLLNQKLTIKTT
jgi:hypothetical protein